MTDVTPEEFIKRLKEMPKQQREAKKQKLMNLYLEDALEKPDGELDEWDLLTLAIYKKKLLASYQDFVEFSFPLIENGTKWINANHHHIMIDTIQKVIDGIIPRLILNVPPRFSKTILTTTLLNAYAMVRSPNVCNNMTVSFNSNVLNDEGKKVRDLMNNQTFRRVFDTKLFSDKISKVDFQLTAGAQTKMFTTFGQITGCSAGAMFPQQIDEFGDTIPPPFAGVMSLDDTLKPADARTSKRETVNDLWANTLVSRLATAWTPVIIIMQRVHENDMAGFMLRGGSGEKWHHLLIKADTTEPVTMRNYDFEKYPFGIPVCYGNSPEDGLKHWIPTGPTWPMRKDRKELDAWKASSPYDYSAQADQSPTVAGGTVFKEEWIHYYEQLPDDIKYVRIYGDTAQKTDEQHDYSCFQAWAYSPTQGIFLIDMIHGKWEAPELKKVFCDFYRRNKRITMTRKSSYRLQSAKIEDKIFVPKSDFGWDWGMNLFFGSIDIQSALPQYEFSEETELETQFGGDLEANLFGFRCSLGAAVYSQNEDEDDLFSYTMAVRKDIPGFPNYYLICKKESYQGNYVSEEDGVFIANVGGTSLGYGIGLQIADRLNDGGQEDGSHWFLEVMKVNYEMAVGSNPSVFDQTGFMPDGIEIRLGFGIHAFSPKD